MEILVKHFGLITLGLLSLGFSISNAQAGGCSLEKVAGRWTFSEHGTYLGFDKKYNLPFSEVGWFKLKKDGSGSGAVFQSVNGSTYGIPPAGISLTTFEVHIYPDCVGRATFYKEPDTTFERSINFVLNSKQDEFQFISTSGDLNTIGTAKRDQR